MADLRYVVLALWLATAGHAIGLADLLGEMINRDSVARWPSPAYRSAQASSYDRATKDRHTEWFANSDFNQFVRTETNGGRPEWVLLDQAGPGAVVRIWSANPPEGCNLRFYFDGASEPGWTVGFQQLTDGSGPVGAPLSAIRSRGWNCYLPIPYAEHLKITADKDGFYYQVGYRSYEPGTVVESFTPEQLARAKTLIEGVQYVLAKPPAPSFSSSVDLTGSVAPGAERAWDLPAGPAAVREISLRVDTDSEGLERELALRSLVIMASFDGEDCLWVPVSDFFGSGVGDRPFGDWYREVRDDGTMLCRWVMPYARRARVALHNLGQKPVRVVGLLGTSDWAWDARSMHFRADWHWTDPLPTRPMSDYRFLVAQGRGVYVGDSLALYNPVTAWWGEGDEKIFVDGETFPSTFGTGTEDYYGYAWGSPDLFSAPFHAQPRVDGPGTMGHSTVSRVRSLDAVPFRSSLEFLMEVWHWADVQGAYASTAYWYALPGARDSERPQPAGATAPIRVPPPPYRIDDAYEAQDVLGPRTAELRTEMQDSAAYGGDFNLGNQLLFHGQGDGAYAELVIPAADAGARRLTLYATKSFDYGILKVSVNGQTALDALDLFSEQVVATGPLDLGVHDPRDGKFVVRVEVVGHNPASRGTKAFFGIDAVAVTKP